MAETLVRTGRAAKVAGMVSRTEFLARAETFGLDTDTPWAHHAFRLLFCVPRAYAPLVDAWEDRFAGTRKALDRLTDAGFVTYQGPVVVDCRTGTLAQRQSGPVARYRITAAGRRLLQANSEDSRAAEQAFPKTSPDNLSGVLALLEACDLNGSHARHGMSGAHAVELSGLAERTGRWWVNQLVERAMLRRMDTATADVREVIPAHWRVTRRLCRQLDDALEAFSSNAGALRAELRLRRSRFLADIDPSRLGISGATDFDHDVIVQQLLARVVCSARAMPEGIFSVEPRLFLPVDRGVEPPTVRPGAQRVVFYQPDAELREQRGGVVVRCVLEYERYQSRRDAWGHIERFCGWLSTHSLAFEPAVLRFVVDTPARMRSYVELVQAFCDYALDHPERMPANPVSFAITHSAALIDSVDVLDDALWWRAALPASGADTCGVPVLHRPDDPDAPYLDYFSRSA